MKVEVRGGGSDCGKGQPLTLPGRDGEVSQVKKGEPATESQYRAARHGGAATFLYSFLAADHLEPGKGTVQRVERRSTTLHHFLKGSDGLSRLLCGSPACSGIMRPCCRRPSTVLQAYVCALLLLLSTKADGEDPECEEGIYMHRNTVYNVSLGERLEISCPVQFCQKSQKIITWYKLEGKINTTTSIINSSQISTKLIMSSPLVGTSYLMFNNIQGNDSGLYRCESASAVGFKIKVSVSVHKEVNNTTNGTASDIMAKDPLLYIYSSAGIVAFVVLVIVVSVVWMRGCRGKPKTEPEQELQYAAVSVRPRGSPPAAASQGSSRREKPPPLQRDGEMTAGGERRWKTAEEKSSLVYAALNHQPLDAAASSRPRRLKEESSEYAAIRVS
ncbi:uncharacterized protein btla isoform X2 [Nelusetta ayraudi]|uniref:uncharacterized protein btla isoform X2 n=1 Tax=Nelusetta ayraudi TaxID=303726 RepID=UPI003F6F5DB7